MKVKYISNAWKNIVYGIDLDPIKSAITSLKSGSVEDIWGATAIAIATLIGTLMGL
jgi:hypothetical protein